MIRRDFLFVASQALFAGAAAEAAPSLEAAPAFPDSERTNGAAVEDFGAIGDGVADDSDAIQAAIDAVEAAGGGVVRLGSHRYRSMKTIRLNPARASLIGRNAVLDFTGKTFVDPDSNPELVANGDFASSSGWSHGPASVKNFVVSRGQLVHTVQGERQYGEIGCPVPLQAGRRYRIKLTVTSMVPVWPQDFSIEIHRDGIGLGPGVGTPNVREPGTHIFEFLYPYATAYLTIKSSDSVAVANVSIKELPDNACLLLNADSGPQYGHATQTVEGLKIIGPGRTSHAEGMVFLTEAPAQSSRIGISHCSIEGCRLSVALKDRAYLIQFYSCLFRGAVNCVKFLRGSRDAGENISFFGCTLGAADLVVNNEGGAGLYFFGCSLDYSGRWYDGRGHANFFGCWFEIARPTAAAQILFTVRGSGLLLISGGLVQISGRDFDQGNSNAYFFDLRDRYSRAVVENTNLYNWRTATGVLATGPGRLMTRGLFGGFNKQLPHRLKRDDIHNLFGSKGGFEGSAIEIMMWLEGGTPTDRHVVQYGRAAISPAQARTGGKSLRVQKLAVGAGTDFRVWFMVPMLPRRQMGWNFFFKAPTAFSGEGDHVMWIDFHFAQVIDWSNSVPALGQSIHYGQIEKTIDLSAGMPGWEQVTDGSTYTDYTQPGDGYAPDWTTHACCEVNLVDMPADFDIYFDDFEAYML